MSEQQAAGFGAEIPSVAPRAVLPEPFDPAAFLDGVRPPAVPYAVGPSIEAETFDPAAFLGARALRGAFNISTVKPLLTTIGGVEMVTVPRSAFEDALRSARVLQAGEDVPQLGAVPDVEGAMGLLTRLQVEGVLSEGQVVEATGLDRVEVQRRADAYATMVADHADVQATMLGPDLEKIKRGEEFLARHRRAAAPIGFVPRPEDARIDAAGVMAGDTAAALDRVGLVGVSEDHGAALDGAGGVEVSEEHGAALDTGSTTKRRSKR